LRPITTNNEEQPFKIIQNNCNRQKHTKKQQSDTHRPAATLQHYRNQLGRQVSRVAVILRNMGDMPSAATSSSYPWLRPQMQNAWYATEDLQGHQLDPPNDQL
jgi:hypothetical protein